MKTFALICAALLFTTACGSNSSPTSSSAVVNVPYSQTDLTVGTGRVAANGNRVFVYYSGWLYDGARPDNKGQLFDSNTSGIGFNFVLGASQVIKGWDQGVLGMAVGGKRRLVLPPSLAYGSAGAGGVIPPNATLVFDIEVVNVTD
jgi:FKBP-type peptidyl-prolyl cis-trans isomerase FkpA